MRLADLPLLHKTAIGIAVLVLVCVCGLTAISRSTYDAVEAFDKFRKGTSEGTLSLARSKAVVAVRSRTILHLLAETDPAVRMKLETELSQQDGRFMELFGGGEAALADFGTDIAPLREEYMRVQERAADLLAMQRAGTAHTDPAFSREFRAYIASSERLDDRLTKVIEAVLREEQRRFDTLVTGSERHILVVGGGTFGLLALTAALILFAQQRWVSGPLKALSEAARSLLAGQIDREVPALDRADEVGSMAVAVERLKQSLTVSHELGRQSALAAQQVATATGQAAAAIEQVSDGAQRQLQSVGAIAGSLADTNGIIGDIADMSRTTKESAQAAAARVMTSMQQIQAMTVAVRDIATTSEQINRITQSIGQLATRSNILSLNAAIEAARAGDQGRGFSVVAEEVGNLAQQTGALAQEIAVLAANSGERIRNGIGVAEEVGTLMQDVVLVVGKTDTLAADIVRSLEEQRTVLRDIENALSGLRQISNANATACEELTATMVELAQLASRSRQQNGG